MGPGAGRNMEVKSEIEKFNGMNYDSWRYRVYNVIGEYNLEDCLDREPEEVTEYHILDADTAAIRTEKKQGLEKRKIEDKKCRSLLVKSIADSQLEYIKDVKQTPKSIWSTLKGIFERSSATNRMHWLSTIISMKFDESREHIEEFFLRFEKNVRLYKGSGAKPDEIDIVTFLLSMKQKQELWTS